LSGSDQSELVIPGIVELVIPGIVEFVILSIVEFVIPSLVEGSLPLRPCTGGWFAPCAARLYARIGKITGRHGRGTASPRYFKILFTVF